MNSVKIVTALGLVFSLSAQANLCRDRLKENVVKIEKNQIVVNGKALPTLYSAELQYFRLRGGYGKNVPREKVIETWARALDAMVNQGKMNAISFYIPWDFHEYAPGKFDFTGTVDTDGSGTPDYPSRDVITFIKMAEARGIKKMVLRPGPYVNAEWGFLGFGAVPEWFHKKYPDSHMQNSKGQRTKLYDYHNEDFLRHTKLWFEALNQQVLSHVVGKGKSGIFLQLDNETNFQWDSLYRNDYGPKAVARYQGYLKNRYRSLKALNMAQGTSVTSWKDVTPPYERGPNLAKDQDWYRFQDWSIFTFLKKVRTTWEEVGVREPNVMFILAESVNAPVNGLLPNYKQKNKKNATGLMTVNMYPKTYPAPADVLFHQPHKSDHDMLAIAASNRHYNGTEQEVVIGPEIHTGWFGQTVLTQEARQQTYLTLLGRGLKAMFFYYFNEGYNWQVEWGQEQILPYFKKLQATQPYSSLTMATLPDIFWAELQSIVDREFMAGWNVKHVLHEDTKAAQTLHFGAPLDANAYPTEHFAIVEKIGKLVIKPYGKFLSKTVSLKDRVAVLADSGALVPSPLNGVDSREMHSDFEGGLVGYLLQANLNPNFHHWGINSTRDLAKNKIIFLQDSGNLNPKMIEWLAQYVSNGGVVVSFIGDSLAKQIGAPTASQISSQSGAVPITYKSSTKTVSFEVLGKSVSEYTLDNSTSALPILVSQGKVIGYDIKHGKGRLIQVGAIIHDAFNTGSYAFLNDVHERKALLNDLLVEQQVERHFEIVETVDKTDVFGRKAPDEDIIWITTKTGQLKGIQFHIRINPSLLLQSKGKTMMYELKDVMAKTSKKISAETLATEGFAVNLGPNGSTAFHLKPLP